MQVILFGFIGLLSLQGAEINVQIGILNPVLSKNESINAIFVFENTGAKPQKVNGYDYFPELQEIADLSGKIYPIKKSDNEVTKSIDPIIDKFIIDPKTKVYRSYKVGLLHIYDLPVGIYFITFSNKQKHIVEVK